MNRRSIYGLPTRQVRPARGALYLTINVFTWCGESSPTWQDNEVYVEVRNLRIVVTR